jgi:hypothetical protein
MFNIILFDDKLFKINMLSMFYFVIDEKNFVFINKLYIGVNYCYD